MIKEFNLSKKIWISSFGKQENIPVVEVKEFIRVLKEEVWAYTKITRKRVIAKIDKLVGDELI